MHSGRAFASRGVLVVAPGAHWWAHMWACSRGVSMVAVSRLSGVSSSAGQNQEGNSLSPAPSTLPLSIFLFSLFERERRRPGNGEERNKGILSTIKKALRRFLFYFDKLWT